MRRLFPVSLPFLLEAGVWFVDLTFFFRFDFAFALAFAISVPLMRERKIEHEPVGIVTFDQPEPLVVSPLTHLTASSGLAAQLFADDVAYVALWNVLPGFVMPPPRLYERWLADDDRCATSDRERSKRGLVVIEIHLTLLHDLHHHFRPQRAILANPKHGMKRWNVYGTFQIEHAERYELPTDFAVCKITAQRVRHTLLLRRREPVRIPEFKVRNRREVSRHRPRDRRIGEE